MSAWQDLTDEQVAVKCLTDLQALSELILRYQSKLERYIQRKSQASADDCQDILQNVFIKVYRNINEFRPSLKFSSWVYRITYNEIIDWFRREQKHQNIAMDENPEIWQNLVAETNVEADIMRAEVGDQLREVVASLPQIYRDIVELRFFEDKSYEEISDILRIPPGTVAARLNRVKAMIKQVLLNV